MELITLNGNMQPDRVVQNYSSLIWSERYTSACDFEFTSSDISGTIKTLPRESVVSLSESTVPMVVETYKIKKPLRSGATITVTGRSFETVLERRISVNSSLTETTRLPWVINAEQPSDAAYKLIRHVIGDIARRDLILPALVPMASVLDAIPELNLPIPEDFLDGTSNPYDIPAKNLYNVVMELLAAGRHGIRAVRPGPGKSTIDLEIYEGMNLTGEGDTGDPLKTVVIDALADKFDDTSYLMSEQGSGNVAYVYGPGMAQSVRKGTGPEPSGLQRRVLVVDEQDSSALVDSTALTNRGLVELYQYNPIALFEGETSVQIANLYNRPVNQGGYALGDIIKLRGDYGLSRYVRVSEFIRTSDGSGVSSYPSFEEVDA